MGRQSFRLIAYAGVFLPLVFLSGCQGPGGDNEKIEVTIKKPLPIASEEQRIKELEAKVDELTALIQEIKMEKGKKL